MADGGNDWELVSLTASAYAAAPGPIPPPPLLQVVPAATSEQSPPSPHPPHPATFMSQHFNLPAEEAPADLLNGGCQELESTTPATLPLDGGLGIPCPEKNKNSCCETETETLDCNQPTPSSDSVILWDDRERKISPSATLDRTRSASPPHSHVSAAAAAAATDGIAVGSAADCLPAPVAAPRVPCEAWWKRTFSFLRGNARESLTFRFVFVADKLQLRLEFGVDSQKIRCEACETLGQVKVSMLGGSHVAQQG